MVNIKTVKYLVPHTSPAVGIPISNKACPQSVSCAVVTSMADVVGPDLVLTRGVSFLNRRETKTSASLFAVSRATSEHSSICNDQY